MDNDSGSLKVYFNEINNIRLITADEEVALGRRIQNGDKNALDKMVSHNLRLVRKFSYNYMNQGVSQEDLIQEGNIGLLTAAQKFDPESGFRFATYATWWIRQNMGRAVNNTADTMRIPNHQVQNINKCLRAKKALEHKMEISNSTPEDIAKYTGDSVKHVKKALLDHHRRATSANVPISPDNDNTELLDTSATPHTSNPSDILSQNETSEIIQNVIAELDNKKQHVIKMRHGIYPYRREYTLDEVGEALNLTGKRIGDIERDVKKLLKRTLKREYSIDSEFVDNIGTQPGFGW